MSIEKKMIQFEIDYRGLVYPLEFIKYEISQMFVQISEKESLEYLRRNHLTITTEPFHILGVLIDSFVITKIILNSFSRDLISFLIQNFMDDIHTLSEKDILCQPKWKLDIFKNARMIN